MKNDKKNKGFSPMKKVISAAGMLAVSASMLGTSTFAWFSMNRTVTATNMTVQATASQSLVIASELGSSGVGTLTNVSFGTAATSLIPATYDSAATYTTHLKYVTNPGEINAASGLQSGTTALVYADAINTADSVYYVDYPVFIASSGGELTSQKLNATLTQTTTLNSDTIKATSVDFYVSRNQSSNLGTYAGTLNLAGLDRSTNNGSAALTTIDLLAISGDTRSIPANKSTSTYLMVTMRVYFDGALLKTKTGVNNATADQAFVYSDSVDTTAVAFKVDFNAVDNNS